MCSYSEYWRPGKLCAAGDYRWQKRSRPNCGRAMAPAKVKKKSGEQPRMSNAERSAYFARKEAAKVLRAVLQGDAQRRAVGSIKSLVYNPSIRNKKATFALVCQTLKCIHLIKDVLNGAGVLTSRWKKQEELMYIITYDILFGKEISSYGIAEKFLLLRKYALQAALARIMVRMNVKRVEDLPFLEQRCEISKPRYVRVNTLKLDVESAVHILGEQYTVQKDDMIRDLLILPSGIDLHDHPLVKDGRVFLQGKASSMVAAALEPKPGWQVLDACSAPGNKTVHLAALMKGKGNILACELHADRAKILVNTVRLAGATNVEVIEGDFLKINVSDPKYSKLRAILLDPSCSGSGIAADRLDYLLPSGQAADIDMTRLTKLAAFQEKALKHALSFPAVERIVYSTCSIHQIENEDVVKYVLPLASSYGFHLSTPFPQWPRRGFPVFDGSEHVLRMDPKEDGEGFFIALFVRNNVKEASCTIQNNSSEMHSFLQDKLQNHRIHKLWRLWFPTRISKMWFYHPQKKTKQTEKKKGRMRNNL